MVCPVDLSSVNAGRRRREAFGGAECCPRDGAIAGRAEAVNIYSPQARSGSLLRVNYYHAVHTSRSVYRSLVGAFQHSDLFDVLGFEPVDAALARNHHGRAVNDVQRIPTSYHSAVKEHVETSVSGGHDVGSGEASR